MSALNVLVGWYYLHQNGNLIYMRELGETAADIRESDFAVCMWPLIPSDRAGAWDIAIEALALGANPDRIAELAKQWQLNDEDADEYAKRAGIVIERDGNMWCAVGPGFVNLQESHAGFGETKLAAMASLAKSMSIPSGKMWRVTFRDMLRAAASLASDGGES